jgi:hypothetical protein
MPLAPQKRAEAEKKGWGFFGRKKAPAPDLRAEPVMPRPAPRPAPAQGSPGGSLANAAQEQAAPPSGEDLFPEHSRDEQFEIPAFLRRQSN